MKVHKIHIAYSLLLSGFFCTPAFAQIGGNTQSDGKRNNNIYTAVPFLLISPDARAGAMGDAGAATSPDVNSVHWNPAKLAFVKDTMAFAFSYTPWLRNLVKDISLSYLSAYRRLDDRNTIGLSMRYFSVGSIQQIDINENDQGTMRPSEFALDGTLARKFGNEFSMGMAFRYIHSQLSAGQFLSTSTVKPVSALSADVSAYYHKETKMFGRDAEIAFGLNISNIGAKVRYGSDAQKYFLPTNMKLGSAATLNLDSLNKLTVTLDLNKLMVPTNPDYDENGNVVRGRSNADQSVFSGMMNSFTDAPGGFAEEIREISYSFGLEYMYNNQFALRAGHFYEHPTKGGRKFFTAGAGFNYKNRFNLDFAYLMADQKSSPLAQTLRLSLSFNLIRSK